LCLQVKSSSMSPEYYFDDQLIGESDLPQIVDCAIGVVAESNNLKDRKKVILAMVEAKALGNGTSEDEIQNAKDLGQKLGEMMCQSRTQTDRVVREEKENRVDLFVKKIF